MKDVDLRRDMRARGAEQVKKSMGWVARNIVGIITRLIIKNGKTMVVLSSINGNQY